ASARVLGQVFKIFGQQCSAASTWRCLGSLVVTTASDAKSTTYKTKNNNNNTKKTGIDSYNFIRDVCAQYFIDHPVEIGGPGIDVEIDESKFGLEVDTRDALTLVPIITSFIRPGSVIYSDLWGAYNGLDRLL
uniref:ISXO2-like transposase domain-containing protein n=1 Tax=Amphimedon queenslandica TaxID=400682 RepID=A0A1X7UPT7_AMPQE